MTTTNTRTNLVLAGAAVLGLAFVVAVVLPLVGHATLPISGTGIESGLKSQFAPWIATARRLGGVALLATSVFEAFKAGRGAGGSYAKAGIQAVVGMMLLFPAVIVKMFGMNALLNQDTGIGGWGILDAAN